MPFHDRLRLEAEGVGYRLPPPVSVMQPLVARWRVGDEPETRMGHHSQRTRARGKLNWKHLSSGQSVRYRALHHSVRCRTAVTSESFLHRSFPNMHARSDCDSRCSCNNKFRTGAGTGTVVLVVPPVVGPTYPIPGTPALLAKLNFDNVDSLISHKCGHV